LASISSWRRVISSADKTVRENVMEGVAESQAILDRYNELAMNYSEENSVSIPAMMRKSVDLPAPLTPSTPILASG
jgi:hypothetical protein